MLMVNKHCAIFTTSIISGHLGRSRRCPLNRGFTVQSIPSLQTPLYYGHFVWSQKCQKSYIPYLYNTDTWSSVKWTLGSVPLVSVLKRFHCTWNQNPRLSWIPLHWRDLTRQLLKPTRQAIGLSVKIA